MKRRARCLLCVTLLLFSALLPVMAANAAAAPQYYALCVSKCGEASSLSLSQAEEIPVLCDVSLKPSKLYWSQDSYTRVIFTLNRSANVTMGVYNAQNELIATPDGQGELEAGIYAAKWDFKMDDGTDVPTGYYFFKLTAQHGGEVSRANVRLTFVRHDSPSIKIIDFPEKQTMGDGQRAYIRLKLTETAYFYLYIYDEQGELVDIVYRKKLAKPGTYTVKWDGCNARGEKLPSGEYMFLMRAVNYTADTGLVSCISQIEIN